MPRSHHQDGKSLLLFLHGLGACGRSFQPVIERLQDLRGEFDFVVLDFWGFGGTLVPPTINHVSIQAFAQQVVGEISQRSPKGTRSVHIIGHSLGGSVATEVHRLFPEMKVDSFVNLEGNLLPGDCSSSLEVSRQNRADFCTAQFSTFKEGVRKLAQSGDVAAQDWILGLEKTTAEVFYDASADLVRASASLYPIYKSWDTHSVYVFGERTIETSKGTYERLVRDGKDVIVIPNAGHVMHREQPEATAEICRRHVKAFRASAISRLVAR